MPDIPAYIANQKSRLKKALAHLEYSYNKVKKLPVNPEQLDDETLEVWESFAARFGRVADIFLTKYLRSLILLEDPGFSGSLRDFVNQGEKLGYIKKADTWMGIRELRNIATYEYTDKDLAAFFQRLRDECPILLSINS